MSEKTKSPLLCEANNHPLMAGYNDALKALYNHVGFREDWVVYPINDCTDMFWELPEGGSVIRYADDPEKMKDIEAGDYYESIIYTQRFYRQHVYRGEELTMVFMDTQTDGMKYFAIFRNDLEVK